jgi:hypothetical protein
MADEKIQHVHGATKTVAWIGLILALLAFFMSWIALNRTGTSLEQVAEESVQDLEVGTEVALAQAQARTRLFALRAELAAAEAGEEAAQAVQAARQDIQGIYTEARLESREEWQEINQELEQAETQARSNTSQALQGIQNSLEAIQRDVQTDED